ncbi:hypothetical protein BDW75DRAFT_82076 [Aspergillus navahoensis]
MGNAAWYSRSARVPHHSALKPISKVYIRGINAVLNSWAMLPDFIIPDSEFEAPNRLDRSQRCNYLFRLGFDVFEELGAEEAGRRAEEYLQSSAKIQCLTIGNAIGAQLHMQPFGM